MLKVIWKKQKQANQRLHPIACSARSGWSVTLAEYMKRILHSILYSMMWVVAGISLFYFTACLLANWNLFTWEPILDWSTVVSITAIIVIEIGILWLAKRARDYVTGIVSLIVTATLVAVGISWFVEFNQETLCGGGHLFIKRQTLSPEWFRITFIALFVIPIVLWGCYPFRYLIKSRKS